MRSLDEFRNVVLNSFQLPPQPPTTCTEDQSKGKGITVAFIRRANYKRRPGHAGDLETRLGNEDEISRALHDWERQKSGAVHREQATPLTTQLPAKCAMLCYAVLCYAVLCYDVLCCAVLCCAVLCCAVLCRRSVRVCLVVALHFV